MNDLNYLMIVIQHFKLIMKLFLKFLILLMILIKINDMKTLMKAMKIIILVLTVTMF